MEGPLPIRLRILLSTSLRVTEPSFPQYALTRTDSSRRKIRCGAGQPLLVASLQMSLQRSPKIPLIPASKLFMTPVTASHPGISLARREAHALSRLMIPGSNVRVTKSSLVMRSLRVPGMGQSNTPDPGLWRGRRAVRSSSHRIRRCHAWSRAHESSRLSPDSRTR